MPLPLRMGVIGVGHMGQHHVRLLQALPDVQLVGICDVQLERGMEQAQRYHTHYFEHYQALLPCVDAVCIAVPTSLHHEIGAACLRSHRHIFIEKPIAATVLEAEALIQSAREHHCILQVGHIERFNPAFLALQHHIGSSAIGHLEAERTHPALDRSNDVSVVIDLMIHDLDLMSALAASPVLSLAAQGYCSEFGPVVSATATLRFANGITGTLITNKLAAHKRRRLKVQGPALDLEANFLSRTLHIHAGQQSNPQNLEPNDPHYGTNTSDPLGAELGEFVTCIREGKDPQVGGRQSLNALQLATQIEETILRSPSISARQGLQYAPIASM